MLVYDVCPLLSKAGPEARAGSPEGWAMSRVVRPHRRQPTRLPRPWHTFPSLPLPTHTRTQTHTQPWTRVWCSKNWKTALVFPFPGEFLSFRVQGAEAGVEFKQSLMKAAGSTYLSHYTVLYLPLTALGAFALQDVRSTDVCDLLSAKLASCHLF